MQPSSVLRALGIPLRTAPLLLVILFSVLCLIVLRAGLLGIPLGLLLLTGYFNYGFIFLDTVASGKDDPPVLSIEMMNPIHGQRSLALLALLVAIFFISDAATYWLTSFLAVLLELIVAITLPAMIAVQGATGSVAQSLDPVRCWRLILRLRGDYVLILICVVLFWGLLRVLFGSELGAEVPRLVRISFFLYAWLAIFALIGTVLLERREDLGVEDADTPEQVALDDGPMVERDRDRQVDRIYGEWRGGAQANAWRTIATLLQQSDDPLRELRWLYQRIARWPDQRLANRLAQEMLPRLLAAPRNGEALDLTRERLRADPNFRPLSGADLLRLARLACDAGDRPSARALLHDFQRFYPNDPLQPAAENLLQQLAR